MADPLKLLREFALEKKTIREKDGLIIFGDVAFDKNEKTNYQIYGKQGEYYTLGCLYFFYQRREMAHPSYVKEAASIHVQPVTRPDRKDLIEFLTKRNAKQPESIDVTAPLPLPAKLQAPQLEAEGAAGLASAEKRPRLEDHELAELAQKEKERLERILDPGQGLRGQDKDQEIRDLSRDLTADKLLAIKSKVKARKRTLIKPTEEDLLGPLESAPLDQEALDKDIQSRERLWRTRTTCMETPAKNFAKSVFPVLQVLKVREEGGGQNAPGASSVSGGGTGAPADGPLSAAVNKPRTVQQAGYSRYDQEKFRKEETEGFQIDTAGTYHGITLKSITEGARPVQQAPGQPAVKSENAPAKPHKRASRTPIIVIPAAATSLVTMYNARELFQDLSYVSTEEKKSTGFRRENEMLIHRQREGGLSVPYRVVDNALKLTAEEWDRVVAVFVQGPAWQFKGWPYGGNPVDIFSRIAAFHLKWDDTKLDGNVAKWNVCVLSLSKMKRHLDRATLLKFWEVLDKYMVKNKSHLRF